MAKRKNKRSFTDLNFSKKDLASNNRQVVAKMGYHLLLRVKPRTAINAVWSLKILAKAQGIKSVAKVVGFRTKTAIKTIAKRFKTGVTRRTKNKTSRKKNGRTIQKSKRKVLMTRTGQPYILLKSGKARFVKRR